MFLKVRSNLVPYPWFKYQSADLLIWIHGLLKIKTKIALSSTQRIEIPSLWQKKAAVSQQVVYHSAVQSSSATHGGAPKSKFVRVLTFFCRRPICIPDALLSHVGSQIKTKTEKPFSLQGCIFRFDILDLVTII